MKKTELFNIKVGDTFKVGGIEFIKFNQDVASYGAWKNHISHGNCYKLGKTMDEKINLILKGR